MAGYDTITMHVEGVPVRVKRRLTRLEARRLTELESARFQLQSEFTNLIVSQRVNSLGEQASGIVRAFALGQIEAEPPSEQFEFGRTPRDVALELVGTILDESLGAVDEGLTPEVVQARIINLDDRLVENLLDVIRTVVIPEDHALIAVWEPMESQDLKIIADALSGAAQAERIKVAMASADFPTSGSSGSFGSPTTLLSGPPVGPMATTSIPLNPAGS